MSARHFAPISNTPGPGTYDNNTLKVKHRSPVFTTAPRSKSTHQLDFENNCYTPGPDVYRSQSLFKIKNEKNPGVIIGKSLRRDLT